MTTTVLAQLPDNPQEQHTLHATDRNKTTLNLSHPNTDDQWPCFLGINHNNKIFQGHLNKNLTRPPFQLVWSFNCGTGYASPIPAIIHNRKCIFVLTGGESKPPTGGLLCINP